MSKEHVEALRHRWTAFDRGDPSPGGNHHRLPCVDQVLHLEIEVLPLLLDVGHIPQIRVGADEDPLLVPPPRVP
jgi:hypothetical protein